MTAAEAAAGALELVWTAIVAGYRAILVNSPPGAGKSTLVREVSRRLAGWGRQIPVIVQTNVQADDLVRGFLRDMDLGKGQGLQVGRLHAEKDYTPPEDLVRDPRVTFATDITALAHCDVVIAPAKKWAFVRDHWWPFAVIDEAYQMRSDDLLPIGAMMRRLLLVGDPGQLAPFTPADDTVLRGLPLSPLDTAAATILTTQRDVVQISLPVSWRLAPHTVEVVADAFYEERFTAGVPAAMRRLELPLAVVNSRAQAIVRSAAATGWAFHQLPELYMPSTDPEAVTDIADIVRELLSVGAIVVDEDGRRPLQPEDVAVGVVHTAQREQAEAAMDRVRADLGLGANAITVDTANRLQGREFEVMVALHPLSGRRDATQFHLDAGRLCVLLSRHKQACIVVTRGGIRRQLEAYPSTEPIWLGERIPVVDGWHAHLSVLDHLDQYRVA